MSKEVRDGENEKQQLDIDFTNKEAVILIKNSIIIEMLLQVQNVVDEYTIWIWLIEFMHEILNKRKSFYLKIVFFF